MVQFNSLEKSAAHFLSDMPNLKRYLKWVYQFLSYVVYRKQYQYRCEYPVQIVCDIDDESFFGYYDKSPDCMGGAFTIFHTTSLSTREKPSPIVPVCINLKNNYSGQVVRIEASYAYNWQQGSKLQWLNDRKFIFNYFDKDDKSYKAYIYDVSGVMVSELESAVYDVFSDEYALTLSFERLNILRPDYGYRCHDTSNFLFDNSLDGIFYFDLRNNQRHLLLDFDTLINLRLLPSMIGANHKVNHIMISPDGERFMFIHRWIAKNGKRYDRLIVSNKAGDFLKIIADDEMVSHCCWYGNNTIIAYMRQDSYGDSFYRINIEDGTVSLLSKKIRFHGDGHPSVHGTRMIFDSYPDRSRMKYLYLYDIENDDLYELGEFFESLDFFEETRCDLHPKWGDAGSSVFIDSVHSGKRKLYKIQLEKIL